MFEDRNINGVRLRADKGGDQWAEDHRVACRKDMYLADCDALLGSMHFGKNGSDTLFMEYVPDDYKNRGNLVRSFATVAMFERKKTEAAANAERSILSAGYYLDILRLLAVHQPVAPRFFFIFGTESPWRMQEICIRTGKQIGDPIILPEARRGWQMIWKEVGLLEAHEKLKKWLS